MNAGTTFWAFDDGILAPHRIGVRGWPPPERLLVYPSPELAERWGGWMPVEDTPHGRAVLRRTFAPDQVYTYRRVSMSQLTDEEADSPFLARGAMYEPAGTLSGEEEEEE